MIISDTRTGTLEATSLFTSQLLIIRGVTMAVGGWEVGISLVGGSEVIVGSRVGVVSVVPPEVVKVALNPLDPNVPSVMSSTVRTFPAEEYRRLARLGRPDNCAQRELGAQMEPSHTFTRSYVASVTKLEKVNCTVPPLEAVMVHTQWRFDE